MMHPTREKFKPYLAEKLSQFGNVPFAMDRGLGIWDTSRRAWLNYDPDGDYHIVIQDDAIIGNRMKERLEAIIEKFPNIAYGLYFGRRKIFKDPIKEWLAKGGIMKRWLNWGVATCVPTKIISGFVDYGDKLKKYDNHDDTKLAKYLEKIKMPIWYPLPSLVDHREDEQSLMEVGPKYGRRAFYFIGENENSTDNTSNMGGEEASPDQVDEHLAQVKP